MHITHSLLRSTLPLVLLCAGSQALASEQVGAPEPPQGEEAQTSFALVEHRWPAPVLAFPRQPSIDRAPSPAQRARPPVRSAARERVLPFIQLAEGRHGLPIGLLDALIATESAYVVHAVSRAGAAGLAQLMPATALELGVSDRFDPMQSIDGGARYLRRMLDRFGSVSLALAAYNAGPGAVLKAGGIPSNRETPGYVGKVIARWLAPRGSF